MMGDLLKNMRSSQIFSVCGLPEIKLTKIPLNPTLQKGEVGAASPTLKQGGRGGTNKLLIIRWSFWDWTYLIQSPWRTTTATAPAMTSLHGFLIQITTGCVFMFVRHFSRAQGHGTI